MSKLDWSRHKGKLHLGLCCINTQLREKNIFSSRSCVRRTFTVERAKELALKNVQDISKMIEWNQQNNIRCFRLSSDMFPHFTDTETEKYTIDFAKPELKRAGDLAKKYGHRIVMHPGQYNQIGSINPSVFEKTREDLTHHANILDAMGMDNNSILIIHGGGTFGDKETTIKRFVENFQKLPQNVKDRLVIENCEKSYSTVDCLRIAKLCNIPVVFDFFHYDCYSLLHPDERQPFVKRLIPQIIESWGNRNILMHISEQGTGKVGHHSDYIKRLPKRLYDMLENHDIHIDLEVEAKMKELAIQSLYEKYPTLF